MVECEASTFPLDNLTKVSTAAHSTQYSIYHCFMARKRHFGAFHSSIVNIYRHRRGRGLSLSPFPPVQQVQLEAGTHPVTVGFSTVWPSLTTKVPRVLTQTVVYCSMCGIPPRGYFIPWRFGSPHATFILTYVTICLLIN